MRVLKFKQAKQLPSRSALGELDRSPRTINDYAKKTPITQTVPSPPVLHVLDESDARR